MLCAVAGCMPLVVCGGRSTAKKSNVTACELESMLYDFVKKIQCGDKNLWPHFHSVLLFSLRKIALLWIFHCTFPCSLAMQKLQRKVLGSQCQSIIIWLRYGNSFSVTVLPVSRLTCTISGKFLAAVLPARVAEAGKKNRARRYSYRWFRRHQNFPGIAQGACPSVPSFSFVFRSA